MKDCIFCKIVKGEAKSWKIYENEYVYAFLDINPVNEYHTLIIPKKHYENIFDTPEDELIKIMSVIKKLSMLYNSKLGIRNVQVINSSGSEAQQDVFHIHFHIVPRKIGDKQDIKWTTHRELRERFDELLKALVE
jgi:histidine triad (HIT) family protein